MGREKIVRSTILNDAVNEQKEDIIQQIFGEEKSDSMYYEACEYLYGLMEQDILEEYLVNGATLTCEKATTKVINIDGVSFSPGKGDKSKLVVNRNGKVDDKANATIIDCKKEKNIFPFGNCCVELLDEEKNMLMCMPDARQKRICKYLMKLESQWDTLIARRSGTFGFDTYPAINMQAVLFCKMGAFIYPLTSGQRVTKYDYEMMLESFSKEDILLIYKHKYSRNEILLINEYELTVDEYVKAQELGLEEEQLNIFKEIRYYYSAIPVLKQEKVIFAFEGLGSNYGMTNKYRIKNQYNAIFVYCENGQIVYACDKCSTLPDTTLNATLKDGVYEAKYHNHHDVYASLQLATNRNLIINDKELKKIQNYHNINMLDAYGNELKVNHAVPAYRFSKQEDGYQNAATGIDLHTGESIKDTSTWSVGCLTVAEDEYYQFGVTAGFIDVQSDPSKYTTYNSFVDYGLITYKELEHWGYTVVNREYMNQTDRRTFLPDYEDEKIN